MTSKKQLKARVRARMAKTGESYTMARLHVAGRAEDWARVFAVNAGGVSNGLRAFVPRMLAAVRAGRFTVVPDGWDGEIERRARWLASGAQPTPPNLPE
ncbi:hypothetical protein OIE67_10575 [Nonomuraea fuscirosea]|uniref:hypothetical protein n=1 Tax=Nonomuraea fuscirosea TaxID=1291556 RepID=UPI002DD83235|nr:hypothetical protein [Nonomuraea fuscirosea]WSA55028.1 hypothetical protein OIE67_10575 [Nonomuraea fuscirosea]